MNRLQTLIPSPHTMLAALALTGLLVTAGCRGDGDANDTDLSDEPAAERVRGSGGTGAMGDDGSTMDEALRSSKLQSLPPAVRLAANKDLVGTSITNVRTQPTEAGLMYRVTYIKGGAARSIMYNDRGQQVSAASATTRDVTDAAPGANLDLRDTETGEPVPSTPPSGPVQQR